jgi:hypothetical protein
MAIYIVKLVDRTVGSPQRLTGLIQQDAQDQFNEAFKGTSDSVSVEWGTGLASDNEVMHFVEDINHSYIRTKYPQTLIGTEAGGHTYNDNSNRISASEIYKHDPQGIQYRASACAKMIMHETLHNQYPFLDVHNDGGGGVALPVPTLPMTDRNKDLIRRAFSVKIQQLL